MALLEIYKNGQGKYVRWGTVVGIAILVGAGMFWVANQVLVSQPDWVKTVAVVIFGIIGAFLAFLAVNSPRSAEFMIMTESEMRKVNWPSRREVLSSTKIVVFLTLLFAIMLALVDFGFIEFFKAIGILSKG